MDHTSMTRDQPAAADSHDGHRMPSHVNHSGHEEMFRQRFWVSLLLSIPVLLYSPMVQQLLGFQHARLSRQPVDRAGLFA